MKRTNPTAGQHALDPWRRPGSSVLLLELEDSTEAVVGRQGRITFPSGMHRCSGSARGPGGLRGRLARHASLPARSHLLRLGTGIEEAAVVACAGAELGLHHLAPDELVRESAPSRDQGAPPAPGRW